MNRQHMLRQTASLGLLGVLLASSVAMPTLAQNLYNPNTYTAANTPAATTPYTTSYPSDNIQLRGHVSAIPQGTTMLVRMDQPISSFSNNLGDAVTATLDSDVFINDIVAIPAGSQLLGQVTNVSQSSRMGKHGQIDVRFFSAKTPDGVVIPLRAHVVTSDESGILRGNSYKVDVAKGVGYAALGTGSGAVLGTAMGGLLGVAGTGAVFGTAVGGIAGVSYALLRKGKDVVIPSGTRLSIMVDQTATVN